MSERQTVGEPFKVSSLKAIRAAIDRFLNQADLLTSRSLSSVIMNLRQMIRPMQFAKNLKTEGKIGAVVHKTPTTCEQLQKPAKSEQRGFTHTCMNPQWSISLFSRLYFAVNSFPEFENEKDFDIKLSFKLTLFFSSTVCKFLILCNLWRDHRVDLLLLFCFLL